MRVGPRARRLALGAGIILLSLLAVRNLVGVAGFALHRAMEGDFAQYYAFGRVGLHDGWSQLYNLEAQRQVWRAVGILLWSPFIYPPPMGWLVAPFSLLPFPPAYALWNVLLAASLLTCWRLVAPGRGLRRYGYLALALALPVIGHGLLLGQVVFVVAAVIAGVAWVLRRDRQWEAGLLLSLIAVKPQLALLVPFALLVAGKRRAFAAWTAASLAIGALAFLALGVHGLQDYLARLLHSADIVSTLYVPVGLTMTGLLGNGAMAHVAQVLVVAATLVVAARSGDYRMALVTGVIGSLLVTPFAHPQDLAVVLPAIWIYLGLSRPTLERAVALAGMWASLLIATPVVLLLPLTAWVAGARRVPGKKLAGAPLKVEGMAGLSVIVPCYNEEGSVEPFITGLMAQARHFAGFEVIVVDDASRDGSPAIIESLRQRYGIRVIRNETNLGLGGAVRRGYDAASMDWVTYLPADGQVPAEEVRKFLPFMSTHDIIIGRRTSTPDYTRYRRLASWVYTTWVSLAFGLRVRDFNWVQGWRRSLWARHRSTSNSVFVCGEFLVRSRVDNPRLVEIEIGYRPRTTGVAKNGSPRAALKAAADISRLFFAEMRAGRLHFLHPITPDRVEPQVSSGEQAA